MARVKLKGGGKLPRTMAELVAMYPPQAIHDAVGYENAQEVVDRLLEATEKRTKDQELYLDTLTVLLEAYEAGREREHFEGAEVTALEVLKTLVEEHGLTPGQLGDILGDRSLGTRILKGERELSKAHIRLLAKHFRVSGALFL